MQDIQKIVGARIRNYRINAEMSQEALADKAGVHPTYIGQVERGEKNVTLKSLAKITDALHLPLATLLDGVDLLSAADMPNEENYPLRCYTLLEQESFARQKELYSILKDITKYGNR